jgi:hypothetical protein
MGQLVNDDFGKINKGVAIIYFKVMYSHICLRILNKGMKEFRIFGIGAENQLPNQSDTKQEY